MAREAMRLPTIAIGHALQLYGMTPRALRFYDEKGLVAPRRDAKNRRVYDHEARERLAWIGPLRRAGISLPAIREILAAPEAQRRERALKVLAERRKGLLAELAIVDEAAVAIASPYPAMAAE